MKPYLILFSSILLATCSNPKLSKNFPEFEEGKLASLTSKETDQLVSSETLEILLVSPQGEIDNLESMAVLPDQGVTVTVMFNQPMVELNNDDQAASQKNMIQFSPELKGTTRWLGTRTLVFIPSDSLPFATSYTVTIPKSLKSLSGKSLTEDYQFSFSTPGVKLTEHYPYSTYQQLSLSDTLVLMFNQRVDLAIAEKIKVVDSNGKTINYNVSQKKIEELKNLVRFYRETDRYSPAYWFERESIAEKFVFLVPTMRSGETYTLLFDDGKVSFNFAPYKPFVFNGISSFSIKPNEGISLSFSNAVSQKDLQSHLTFTPKIDSVFSETIGNYYATTQNLFPPFKAATIYTATISKNLVDRFGNKLGNDVVVKINVEDYLPRVVIPTGIGLVENDLGKNSLNQEEGGRSFPSIAVRGMNIPSVELKYAMLSPEDVMSMKTDYYGSNFEVPPSKLKFTTIEFSNKKNESSIRLFDLREVFGGKQSEQEQGKQSGIAYIEVNSPSLYEKGKFEKLSSLLQVTSLGVSAKWSKENSLVWVTKLADASPVSNASVKIYQKGKLLYSGSTNDKGVAEIKQALNVNDATIYAFVTYENQLAYTTSGWDYGIEPYRFGLYDIGGEVDYNPQAIVGNVFTERGIYRAGETIFFKGVLREMKQGKWKTPKFKQVQVTVLDSKDEKIYSKLLSVSSDFGSFSDSLKTKGTAPLGYYTIQVKSATNVDSYPLFASEQFRVEAYRPSTFETKISSAQKTFVRGENFTATIDGRYLFGAPMIGDPAKWMLTSSKLDNFSFPDYDGYFWQPLSWGSNNRDQSESLLASGSGTLDKLGQLSVSQKLEFELSSPTMITLEGEVTAPSRQAIAERQSFRFHPGLFYIGLKPKTTFIKENSELPIEVVSLSVDGKAESQKIGIEVIHRQWISVKRAGVGGRFEWHSEQVDSTIVKTDVTTKTNNTTIYNAPIKGAGLYFVRASAKDSKGNTIRSEAYTYAYGGGYSAWERSDDDRVTITANKKSYRPNEIASLLIQSPYEEATALLSIEREGIIEQRVFQLSGTAPSVDIQIKDEYLPNVYASIMLIKGRTSFPDKASNDLGKPSFKIGYVKLPVESISKKLQVKITTNKKEFRSGEIVEAEIDVKDANGNGVRSEVSIAAVDAGVLNLIGYTLPDAFSTFYKERGLGVKTSQSLLHLIEQRNYGEKGEARGGDKGGEGTGGYAFRQNFITTAYWNPNLITDQNGKSKIQFKLPDNLTTFRLMAFSHTETAFGKSQTDIVVNQPLSIIASLPRFARIGDSFEAGVTVSNYTQQKTTVKISATASGIKTQGDLLQSISLEPNQSREVRFKYEAENEGLAEFSFAATSDAGNQDALKTSIVIQTPYIKETLALVGSTDKNSSPNAPSVSETVRIPKNIYHHLGDVTAHAASTALVGLREAAQYVFDYPYGCLEQKASSILPYIVGLDLIKSFNLKTKADTAKGGIKAVVERTLGEFEKFQTYGGGYGYWQGGSLPNDYVSVFATYTLLKANEAGYDVDEIVLRRSLDYLKTLLNKNDDSFYGYRSATVTKAFALYALSLAGEFNASATEKLYQERSKLSVEAKSYLLKVYARQSPSPLLASKGKVKFSANTVERIESLSSELMNSAKVQEGTIHFEDGSEQDYIWTFGSNVKTTSVVLTALIDANKDKSFAEKGVNWLLSTQKNGRWQNTQENIFAIEALNSYFRKFEEVEPNFSAKLSLASQTLLEQSFKGRTLDAKVQLTMLDKFSKGENISLNIDKSGVGRLYYGIRLAYYPTYALQARDNGIALFKSIKSLSEKSESGNTKSTIETKVSAGEIVKITLQVAISEEMNFVAINDALPAGLEAINPTLKTTGTFGIGQQQNDTEESAEGEYGDADNARTRNTFDHIELRDDRVTLFAERLSRGIHSYTYYARATTYGTFTLPPSTAEKMYQPEVFGRTGTSRLIVSNK